MSKTVAIVSASAVGASAISSADSAPLPMDHYEHDFKVGFGVDLFVQGSAGGTTPETSGASGTYTVQFTYDDPAVANAVWFDHALSAQTADNDGSIDFPVNAMRVQVQVCASDSTNSVSARAALMVIQAGDMRYEPRKNNDIP